MSTRRTWLPPHFNYDRPVFVGVVAPPSPPHQVQRDHRVVSEALVHEIGLYARLRVGRDVSQGLRAISAVASALNIGFMLASDAAIVAPHSHEELGFGSGRVAVEIAPDAIYRAVATDAAKLAAAWAQLRRGPRHGAGGLWLAAETAEGCCFAAGWQARGRRPGPTQAINKWIAANAADIMRFCPWVGQLPTGRHPRDLMKMVADARRTWRTASPLRHDLVERAEALMLNKTMVKSLKTMANR